MKKYSYNDSMMLKIFFIAVAAIIIVYAISGIFDSNTIEESIFISDISNIRQYSEQQNIDFTFFQCIVEEDNSGDFNIHHKYIYDKDSIDNLLELFKEYEDTYDVLYKHAKDNKLSEEDTKNYIDKILDLERRSKNL